MKKFFTILLIVIIAFVPFYTKAHATAGDTSSSTIYDDPSGGSPDDSDGTTAATPPATTTTAATPAYDCSSINNLSSYNICCSANGDGTSAQCDAYEAANPALTSAPGQLGAGTQATNPVDDGTSTDLQNTYSTGSVQDVASTCSAIQFLTIISIAIWVKCIIGAIVIPGIFTLAFVVFLWGVFKFIRASDKTDKDDSKQFIYMGLIGLFVMTSVWGIIKIFTTTLGVDTVVPTLQTDYLPNSAASTTTPTNPVVPVSSGNGTSQ
jgi:hypothetical protein